MKNMKKMGMKKMMKRVMGGEDKSMNAMQQMKYGSEKMMYKATMGGQLDKAMGSMEMKKMMKGGEKKYPKRLERTETNKMKK